MKIYVLLLFFISLLFSEALAASSSVNGPDVSDDTDVFESNSDLAKRNKYEGWGELCSETRTCNPGLVCWIGFCVDPFSTSQDGRCRHDRDCPGGICMGGFCVDPDFTAVAPDLNDPSCKKDSDCGDGTCMAGICLAPSKRLSRRSPQDIATCRQDGDCRGGVCMGGFCVDTGLTVVAPGPDSPSCNTNADCRDGVCLGGVCHARANRAGHVSRPSPEDTRDVAPENGFLKFFDLHQFIKNIKENLPSRVDDPVCHADSECHDGICRDGYCIAPDNTAVAPAIDDPSCKKDADCGDGTCMAGICLAPSKMRFARRSPDLSARWKCKNDAECDGGYCYNGICIADPPNTLEARWKCKNDAECDGGFCYNGICIADPPPRV
ncbi:hypothetical protein BJX61DRAFT_541109 [Aspergillus egyptiacus]|nr:hypothetical protein BJX61DRAFT_541109 [Aspergillus egyptiacus]